VIEFDVAGASLVPGHAKDSGRAAQGPPRDTANPYINSAVNGAVGPFRTAGAMRTKEPLGCPEAPEDFSERPAVNVVAGREMIYQVRCSEKTGSDGQPGKTSRVTEADMRQGSIEP
jgi:hypothetical protein